MFRSITLAGVALAATAVHAHAMTVLVRDAAGGENSFGSPGGIYLVGTGSRVQGMVAGQMGGLPVGTFDLELDIMLGMGYQTFLTYCTEPEQVSTLTFPAGTFFVSDQLIDSGFQPAEVVYMQRLWAAQFVNSQASPLAAAAFQAVTWELTEDDDQDLTAGNFKINAGADAYAASVAALAQTWLTNAISGVWTDEIALNVLVSDESQDLLIPARLLVPAPGVAALLAPLALAAARRRRS